MPILKKTLILICLRDEMGAVNTGYEHKNNNKHDNTNKGY